MRAVAEVAAVRCLDDQLDEGIAAESIGERPGRCLAAPHQRGMNDETMVHPQRQCRLQRL